MASNIDTTSHQKQQRPQRQTNNQSTNSTNSNYSNSRNSNHNRKNQFPKQSSNQSNKLVRKKDNSFFNEPPVFSCPVCCSDFPSSRYKAIFAIGQCNHMICYYCSTKMRVLCEQNECPICRQELAEVNYCSFIFIFKISNLIR